MAAAVVVDEACRELAVWRKREHWLRAERIAAFRAWITSGRPYAWHTFATLTRICNRFELPTFEDNPALVNALDVYGPALASGLDAGAPAAAASAKGSPS